MNRRNFLKNSAKAAVTLALSGCTQNLTIDSESTRTKKPNIILIMVDDMGYEGLSCYGSPHYKTPNIDRLCTEGLKFTDFHSSGAVCSPTRAGLLTGRYQQRAGIEAVIHANPDHPEHLKGLQETEITFAEVLKKAGYTTGLIGKWHLGYAKQTPKYNPLNHGFDYFVGYLSGNIDYISHYASHIGHDWFHGHKERKEEGYTTHLINKYALKFIEKNKKRPFCLYLPHEAIHAPIQGPNDPVVRGPGSKENPTPKKIAFQQMTAALDEGVGQIRQKLIDLGIEKNTFVFFFSDNGGEWRSRTNSRRFRGTKSTTYEGGHRVPAIAFWPGKIKPNSTTSQPAISIDLTPTILALAGCSVPKGHHLDGIDLSSLLLENKPLPPRPLFWAHLGNSGGRTEAMRDGHWKLVVNHPKAKPGTFENEKIELYNLNDDPGEKNDLKDTHPQRAKEMLRQLKRWYKDVSQSAPPQPGGYNK
ncbi:MAG: sulfatase-like hydrolase/transferase [Planctomycetota bacterium]|jgi:arylsulfatase A-like enzyme